MWWGDYQTRPPGASQHGMIEPMAKKINWVLDRNERPQSPKKEWPRLIWLKAGHLANLVVVEKTGRGSRWQKAPKRTRVIATVMVLRVFSDCSRTGMSEILFNGSPLVVNNTELRPLVEDE